MNEWMNIYKTQRGCLAQKVKGYGRFLVKYTGNILIGV